MNRHLGSSLRLAAWIISAMLLGGCGESDNEPAPVARTSPPPPPPALEHIVAVEVHSATDGPVADATVWVRQVDTSNGLTFTAWDYDFNHTDTNGLFSIGLLIGDRLSSRFSVLAEKPGFVQPCAVRAEAPETQRLRVEMVATWVLDQFDPPRPQSGAEPWLTGEIFEMTSIGRQPIPAVQVRAAGQLLSGSRARTHDDIDLATTESDLDGGFFLCNLGPAVRLQVSKAGFRDRRIGPFDGMEPRHVEIELERL